MPPSPAITASRPYLHRSGKQYQFAKLVWEGLTYEDACKALGVKLGTAQKWRRRLCWRTAAYEGRESVNYEYALRRYVFGKED